LWTNAELREITSRSRKRDSSVMMSSVRPSAKNSCSGSPLMLANGRTAIDGLAGAAAGLGAEGASPASSSTTRKARIGRAMFFTVCSPRSSKPTPRRFPTWSRTAAATQMPPGSATSCRRAATLTPSPKMSSSSTMTSPRLIATRNRIQRAGGTSALRLAMRRWISTAHWTASMTLLNSTRRPSPVVLMVRP
jgi:hypothetical protein